MVEDTATEGTYKEVRHCTSLNHQHPTSNTQSAATQISTSLSRQTFQTFNLIHSFKMYFSRVIAITVLTFAASAVAAPTATEFNIAAPVDVREAEADGTSFDVETRQVDVDIDVDVDGDFPLGVADLDAREAEPNLEARGFGCGVFSSRYECNDHVSNLAVMYQAEVGVPNVLFSARALVAVAPVGSAVDSCTTLASVSLDRQPCPVHVHKTDGRAGEGVG